MDFDRAHGLPSDKKTPQGGGRTSGSRSACRVMALLGMTLGLGASPVFSGDKPPIAGDYECVSLCRPADAPPSIEIVGNDAHCMSELGGIYDGRLLSARSVACFRKTGTLSDDGKSVVWSDGVIWKRR